MNKVGIIVEEKGKRNWNERNRGDNYELAFGAGPEGMNYLAPIVYSGDEKISGRSEGLEGKLYELKRNAGEADAPNEQVIATVFVRDISALYGRTPEVKGVNVIGLGMLNLEDMRTRATVLAMPEDLAKLLRVKVDAPKLQHIILQPKVAAEASSA
ncbi:Uncharacterised protein [uncultured archaeon]|nr:Uncharacterised protein [uncultured archaeon]